MSTEEIYKFMETQNRPYSANDIIETVGKELGKSAVLKAIDNLVRQNKLIEKVYGKQKVYCITQEDIGVSSMEEELRQMDRDIGKVTSDLRQVEEKLGASAAELKSFEGKMTIEEARMEKNRLEGEISRIKSELDARSESSKPISDEEKLRITTEHENYRKEYVKRRKICTDIINTILEGYPKTKKHLLEDIGIETDEDVGFKFEK